MICKKSCFAFYYTILILVFALLSGCAGHYQRSVFDANEMNWQTLSTTAQTNYKKLKTLEGWGTLTVQSPMQAFSAEAQVKIKKPDSLFLKIEAAFGIDVGVFFADRSGYLVYSPMQNLCYTGSVDSMQKSPFIDMDMGYEKLFQIFTGVEVPLKLENQAFRWKEKEILYSGERNALFYHYTIDSKTGLVKKVEVMDENNQVQLRQEYTRFAKINGAYIPQSVKIVKPVTKEFLSIFYSRLKINKSINSKEFIVKMPDNVMRVNL